MNSTSSKLLERELLTKNAVASGLRSGRIVALYHKGEANTLIGRGCTTKVNTNIGVSLSSPVGAELTKLTTAITAGTDTVMDLSTRDANATLSAVLKASSVPVGTVPIYSCFRKQTPDSFFNAIRDHVKLGASFLTLHSAITKQGLAMAKKRVLKIVSRGGCLLSNYMTQTGEENPLYLEFDYILEIMKGTDCAVSVGDALRPGALADANDEAQLLELKLQREIVIKCRKAKVPVFCEGPGHMPLDTITQNIKLQKKICLGAPYYVLGPLTTDLGVGYDHITAAIGGAQAAAAGADFLCVVTPAEHHSLPNEMDIRDGVIAARIAAHSGDIVKLANSSLLDHSMSEARAAMDWRTQEKLSISGIKIPLKNNSPCSMCGELCAIIKMKNLGK